MRCSRSYPAVECRHQRLDSLRRSPSLLRYAVAAVDEREPLREERTCESEFGRRVTEVEPASVK